MAEFTGERVMPGDVAPDLWNEHLARYAFAARLARNRRVLDIGCGAGYGSAELARAARSVVACDLADQAVSYAQAHFAAANIRFLRASATALPLADAAIDLAVAFEVIEHIEDWRGLIEEARRVLAPGGQFIVSTPNRDYYAESRRQSGPNPFHVHEFDFAEFRDELASVFPHVLLFLENHAQGIVFRPLQPDPTADVRVDGGAISPEESHFFVAVCARTPQTGAPTFLYVPSAANVLREREHHIERLDNELALKDQWLEQARLEKQEVVEMFRRQTAELEQRNRWAEQLNRDLEAASARIVELQQELAREQQAASEVAAGYESKIAELDQDARAKAQWAVETEARLGAELAERCEELKRAVDLLDKAEATVTERTEWAQRLEAERAELEAKLAGVAASRWIRLGKALGVGPGLGNA